MSKKFLFLDDVRVPKDCSYMKNPELYNRDWDIVRNHDEFVNYILKEGVPDFISFDHDLSDEHYSQDMYKSSEIYNKLYGNFKEKTGYDCAKWLCNYCAENSIPLPEFEVHSMNPVGRENIIGFLNSYKKFEERVN